jgi:cytoskeleton protein RodZ
MVPDMAEGTLSSTSIGVGPALRRARTIRGITLEEAARDTKLRAEQLDALEAEHFDVFSGEVYARGALRTYAQYLGLNADRVLATYGLHAAEPEPPPPPAKLGRVERAIAATRVRDNQRFMLIAAAAVLLSLIGVGLVSRQGGVPVAGATATAPSIGAPAAEATDAGPLDRSIDVVVQAVDPVTVTVTIDGLPGDPTFLRAGEIVSFRAAETLDLGVSDGGAVSVSVGGRDVGTPGISGKPWSATYSLEDAESVAAGA